MKYKLVALAVSTLIFGCQSNTQPSPDTQLLSKISAAQGPSDIISAYAEVYSGKLVETEHFKYVETTPFSIYDFLSFMDKQCGGEVSPATFANVNYFYPANLQSVDTLNEKYSKHQINKENIKRLSDAGVAGRENLAKAMIGLEHNNYIHSGKGMFFDFEDEALPVEGEELYPTQKKSQTFICMKDDKISYLVAAYGRWDENDQQSKSIFAISKPNYLTFLEERFYERVLEYGEMEGKEIAYFRANSKTKDVSGARISFDEYNYENKYSVSINFKNTTSKPKVYNGLNLIGGIMDEGSSYAPIYQTKNGILNLSTSGNGCSFVESSNEILTNPGAECSVYFNITVPGLNNPTTPFSILINNHAFNMKPVTKLTQYLQYNNIDSLL